MFITGHVAASLLASRRWDLDARLVVAATLFPDAIDKSAHHILHIVPSGRLPTHTLLALALTSGAVYVAGRRRGQARNWTLAWLAGYVLHLLCDFAAPVPLLWPFAPYDLTSHSLAYILWHSPTPIEIVSLFLEGALVLLAAWVEWRRCQGGRASILPRC